MSKKAYLKTESDILQVFDEFDNSDYEDFEDSENDVEIQNLFEVFERQEGQDKYSQVVDIDVAVQFDERSENNCCLQSTSKSKPGRRTYNWRKKEFHAPKAQFVGETQNIEESNQEISENMTPLQYFLKYFPREFIQSIATLTNERYLQERGNILNTNSDEIYKMMAISITIGTMNLPRIQMYWKKTTKVSSVAEIISRHRFHLLRNSLKFCDKSSNTDKIWKVRPVVDSVLKRCSKIKMLEFLSIDEMMLPFKGRTALKQYMPKKPNKWGIKIFVICSIDGVVHDFEIYQGKGTSLEITELGFCGDIVLRLVKLVPNNTSRKIFFDNYFTSIPLIEKLQKKGIYATGTLRANRMQGANNLMLTEKELKQNGRGSYDFRCETSTNIFLIRWFDSGLVQLASSIYGTFPVSEVKRYCAEKKQFIQIPRPEIIYQYNKNMGAVDKMDFLLSLYRISIKSRKWTLKVFDHLIDLSVCNSWLEYKRDMSAAGNTKFMDLLEFRNDIVEGLLFSTITTPSRKRGRPSKIFTEAEEAPITCSKITEIRPCISVRYDLTCHWPIHTQIRGRCKLEGCKGTSRQKCEKCDETLSSDGVPSVVMKSIHKLEVQSENEIVVSTNLNKTPSLLRKHNKNITSWSVNSNFKLILHSIQNLNCDLNKKVEVGVHLGLFHGDKTLCASKKSSEHSIGNDKTILLEEEIVFDINLQNIPRMTRLCIGIYEVSKSVKLAGSKPKRVKDNKEPYMNNLAWVNVTLFDFKDELKSSALTLYTWNYADNIQSDDIFNSLGTVEQNPRIEECATIKLSFHNYDLENNIMYPSEEIVLHHASEISKTKCLNRDSAQDTRPIKQILEPYLSNDRLYEMHDQERNVIWAKRLDCLNDAHYALPLLLHCVEWNKRDEVSEICRLLKKWPPLSVERALELLDYTYPDPTVRRFAINCLEQLRDEELLLYLLQLVQAIKHESYLDCELVKFLLKRALENQRIGHYFFWHLKSEMQMPAMQIRFGLILEAYLQGSHTHIPLLYKQFECLEKLRQGSELARKGNKEKVKSSLQDFLTKERNGGVFANLLSPLNPYFRCKGVKPEKCKIMDSKMRPLWIVFENADTNGDDIYIIFKNGDDLRQDMLTLQMLRVMDQLWKNEGYDFRMNIYGCISMERRMGMIEVVLNAETIANIQKEKGMFSATSPFKKGSLLSWLKEYNPSEELLEKAIKEFTLSCAGYCVATYVLGVADRHSDNIMVKKTGQLFHIDFGHILGHFKEKFGVRRERVPFVLTHDFVYVINNGRTDRETEEFRTFQSLCETAFLILRRHGCLILSLFAMMISTGLPELSSEKDLNYLKETLVLDFTEESAREHFRSKFNEALANSWKTSLNWASHNFSKNNKQ